MRHHSRIVVTVFALGLAVGGLAAAPADSPEFGDITEDSKRFMAWYEEIELTPEQEAIKREALTALPAPCCSDNTAYTCCCPCNLSKTIWGLSNHLIAQQGADAATVKATVERWIEHVNPNGFSGDVCYSAGGCGRSFDANGCGGMHASALGAGG